MNVFETCLPKRTGTPIYLPEDDDYENTTQHRNCFSCCLWTNKFSRQNREGLIRLPEGGRRTIDDYLDPRSPVSIEVLLAEQEEELDHYLGQTTDDEDAFVAKRKYSLVSHSNAAFEEEDAQFLSEHRISAILVDRPKLSSAHVFNTENVIDSTSNNNNQELLDVVIPAVSTSTSSISSRVFAIKIQPEDEDDFNKKSAPRPITDVLNISNSPKEMRSTSYRNHHISSSSSSSSSSATSILSSTSTAEHENNYVLPSHLVVGSSTSLSVFPPTNITSSQQSTSRTSDFPATTLTRTPYQPPPPMQLNIPPSTPPRPIPSPSAHNTPIIPAPFLGRRPSVVQAAQNLLGDKLDDFTEKLAFIKKNIIMSMDSEDEEELSENNHYYNTANTFNKGRNRKSLESSSSSRGGGEQSGERTWDNFILPKFKKQASTSTSFLQQNKRQQEEQMMRIPDSHNNAVPLHVTRDNNNNSRISSTSDHGEAPKRQQQRRNSNASFSNTRDSEEEEIFDFSKISKNVRTFSEGVMGNGLRMFNNLSTRIKNANHNELDQLK